MAKNSRKRIGAAGAVLALALAVSNGVMAGGLPLRAGAPAQDRVLSGLAEGLTFKLNHLENSAAPTWAALVDDTALMAQRLGVRIETPVTAHRLDAKYAVVLEGETYIVGSDPDQVLGRLLYLLAHAPDASPAALAILDQPLSATLAALPSLSSP